MQLGKILSMALASCVNLLNFSSNSTFLWGGSLSTDLSGLKISNSELLSKIRKCNMYHLDFELFVIFSFVDWVIYLILFLEMVLEQIQPLVQPLVPPDFIDVLELSPSSQAYSIVLNR